MYAAHNLVERKEDAQLVITYINGRHFAEEKGTGNDDFHVIVGTDDSFIEL